MKVKSKTTQAQWGLLPPASDVCQICAVKHDKDEPHNKNSLYYQMRFKLEHNRYPTWKDALSHCPVKIKKLWERELINAGERLERDIKRN